jgi:hypothetical protein
MNTIFAGLILCHPEAKPTVLAFTKRALGVRREKRCFLAVRMTTDDSF